jgi:hypothetical protein
MGRTLDQALVAERLRIPAYLTVNLETRDANITKVTMKTSKGLSAAHATNAVRVDESAGDSALGANEEKDETRITNNDKELQGTSGEDEDLDSWLESVIT